MAPTADEEPPTADETTSNANEANTDEAEAKVIKADAILYGVESFNAVVQPVLITMILAALAVKYINTPEVAAAAEASLTATYNVAGNASTQSTTGGQLSAGLVNALVIVIAIGIMTCVMVLLYKYRCMKILMGYMVLSSAMLLGYLSSVMFAVAVDRYQINIDTITFWLLIYNFAVVGTAAIFYGRGFPSTMAQAYLILTSVIVAWQLSFFDTWTAWMLLILLALYDLFAVLSPCGPLKALVNLMSAENAPEMPGLLYEARLPGEARRPSRAEPPRNAPSDPREPTETAQPQRPLSVGPRSSLMGQLPPDPESNESMIRDDNGDDDDDKPEDTQVSTSSSGESSTNVAAVDTTTLHSHVLVSATTGTESTAVDTDPETSASIFVTGEVPFALAKMYKLLLVEDPQPWWVQRARGQVPEDEPAPQYTTEQLREVVSVRFLVGGGRIVLHEEQLDGEELRYDVLDRNGNRKRTLFVNNEGRVMQDLRKDDPTAGERKLPNSIRLGLGDFIFYSILVSKAAVYSFTTFASCALVILVGLGLTLLLLAVYGKALPALPISIFLGVIFYLLARFLIQPWVQEIFIVNCYV